MFSIPITDDTTKKIAPKATDADYDNIKAAIAAGGGDEGLNPGDTVTIMTSDLFTVMDGYNASYGVSVEGDSVSASASGDRYHHRNGADHRDGGRRSRQGHRHRDGEEWHRPRSSRLRPHTNVAELTFPVMVVDTTLVVTLSADPMEIDGRDWRAARTLDVLTATA